MTRCSASSTSLLATDDHREVAGLPQEARGRRSVGPARARGGSSNRFPTTRRHQLELGASRTLDRRLRRRVEQVLVAFRMDLPELPQRQRRVTCDARDGVADDVQLADRDLEVGADPGLDLPVGCAGGSARSASRLALPSAVLVPGRMGEVLLGSSSLLGAGWPRRVESPGSRPDLLTGRPPLPVVARPVCRSGSRTLRRPPSSGSIWSRR